MSFRFDEVSMLESNLRDLQLEFQKTRSQQAAAPATNNTEDHTRYESFNLQQSESAENIPHKVGYNLNQLCI